MIDHFKGEIHYSGVPDLPRLRSGPAHGTGMDTTGLLVARLDVLGNNNPSKLDLDLAVANAKHLADCWNALVGMDPLRIIKARKGDTPIFIISARDRGAPELVAVCRALAITAGAAEGEVAELHAMSEKMSHWQKMHPSQIRPGRE